MMTNKLKFSYAQMEHAIDNFVDQINKQDITYDYIYGIARGGLVPAVRMSHRLGIPMKVITWSTRDGNIQNHNDIIEIVELLNSGKMLLVVEDIIDSGRTINSIFEYLNEQLQDQYFLTSQLHIATMINNVDVNLIPAYTSISISRETDDAWYEFWWENKNKDETYSPSGF